MKLSWAGSKRTVRAAVHALLSVSITSPDRFFPSLPVALAGRRDTDLEAMDKDLQTSRKPAVFS